MRAAVDADVAITNGGGIRADREYAAGTKLTRGDILAELPFGNKTVKLELTGAQLREALENGFSQVEEGTGRFPQVSGLAVEVDLSKPAGERVKSVDGRRRPLDDAKTYTLATNDFMARGGDGYSVLSRRQAADRPDRRAADGKPGDRLRRGRRHGPPAGGGANQGDVVGAGFDNGAARRLPLLPSLWRSPFPLPLVRHFGCQVAMIDCS